jgi:SAM-dependent methyltransferase
VISTKLLSVARCPECAGAIVAREGTFVCSTCGRLAGREGDGFLDLRPEAAFAEQTKYLDEALHADARHETVSPPLLSAKIRNDMLRRFLAPGPSDCIVDLGCGSGRVLVWNRDLGACRVGVDVSPFFARDALAGVDLALGDLRRLPLADASFTKAYSLDVLEHLSREALDDMLREASRILRPGGALFVYSHVRKNSPLAGGLRLINRLAGALDRAGAIDLRQERLRKSDHQNPIADHDDLRRVVEAAGFRVGRIRFYTPLVGGFFENILLRMGERMMMRRRHAERGGSATEEEALKAARRDAKERIANRGPLYAALAASTWLMKLDIVLFGRIRSGPFFALLVKR